MTKYIYIILALTLLGSTELFACNTCGCGVSNYHYGILPQFQKNFIGLRYRYRTYVSQLEAGHLSPYSYETFQSTELWGRFYPTKRLQAFVFVPYNFNERNEGEKTTYVSGVGDVVLSVNYNLLNTYDSATLGLSHNLLVGAGVKLPTGQFRKIKDGLLVNQNFQLGTGSVDFLFNVIYMLRYKSFGLNTEMTYSYNTANRDEYRFGNTSRSGITAFFIPKTGAVTIMPNIGAGVETYNDNEQYKQAFSNTGGWAILYTVGIESYYKQLSFGISYAHPGKQELFNGNVTSNERLSLQLTVMF